MADVDSTDPSAEFSGQGEQLGTQPLSHEELIGATCLVCESEASVQFAVQDSVSAEHFGDLILLCDECGPLLENENVEELKARVRPSGETSKLVTVLVKAQTFRHIVRI